MTDDTEVHSKRPSRDELVASVINAALSRLTIDISTFRLLLVDAQRRDDEPRERPPDLRRSGRRIPKEERRQAERAVDELWQHLWNDAEELLQTQISENAQESDPDVRHYPMAPEQMVACLLTVLGPDRVQSRTAQLYSRCGNNALTLRYALEYARWRSQDTAATIGQVLLPAAVSTFEEMLAALVRLWLTLHPKALGADKTHVEAGEIVSFTSIDDLKRLAIDRRVDGFMSESPFDWNRRLEQDPGIDLSAVLEDWPAILEAFARRNALVHAGRRVDTRYLSRLPHDMEKPPLGAPLTCDREYTSNVLDLLQYGGMALAVAWLSKFAPGSQGLFDISGAYVVTALRAKRWRTALFLADTALAGQPASHEHHELRINRWMARRELGESMEVIRKEMAAWVPPPGEPSYVAAAAALVFDERATVGALRECAATGNPPLNEMRDWPLMVDMARHSPAVGTMLRSRGHSTGSEGPHKRNRRKR